MTIIERQKILYSKVSSYKHVYLVTPQIEITPIYKDLLISRTDSGTVVEFFTKMRFLNLNKTIGNPGNISARF